MSINAYVGLPGSGKSYNVVANVICNALDQGRTVVTNLPLRMEEVSKQWPNADVRSFPLDAIKLEPGLLMDHAVPGCVLVIDELWKLWPAGVKVDKVPDVWKSLLAEHRHMVDAAGNSMQIVFVTQDLAQLGAFARQLVENTYVHTKLGHLGLRGAFRVDVYPGGRAGLNVVESQRLRYMTGKYSKEIFALYESHTLSESTNRGANEVAMDKRANVWRRPGIWIGAAGVVAAIVWGVPAIARTFHKPAPAALAPKSGPVPGPLAGGLLQGVARPPSVEAPSSSWRVAGIVDDGREKRAFLTDGRVTVVVPYRRFCSQVAEGWTSCQWQGREVTEWSAAPSQPRVYFEPASVLPHGGGEGPKG